MTEAIVGLELPAPGLPEARRPWWRVAGSLVAGIAFGLMVGLAALAVLATQFLGFRLLTVSSDSMSPALSTGDVIFVKPASVASVQVGDVVLFESGGDDILTVHRVVARNEVVTNITSKSTGDVTTLTEYRLITKGDANPAPDGGEVIAPQLHGEVWFAIPNPLSSQGIPFQALLFALAGVTGLAWLAWETSIRLKEKQS